MRLVRHADASNLEKERKDNISLRLSIDRGHAIVLQKSEWIVEDLAANEIAPFAEFAL